MASRAPACSAAAPSCSVSSACRASARASATPSCCHRRLSQQLGAAEARRAPCRPTWHSRWAQRRTRRTSARPCCGAPGKSTLCCSHVGSHRHRMRPSCALSARAVPGEQWCSERWGARQCPDLGPERGSGARSNCCERAGWGRWRRARQRRARRTRCCSRWTRITRAAACGAPCWTSWARCGARGRTHLHVMQGRAWSSMLHCVGRCKEALCVKM